MRQSRTRNASRNIVTGFLNKIITLVLPFISRTLIIYLLGVSYLGIGTLFTSILSFLSLAELGLSSAIVFAMYEPVSLYEYETINELLKYYRRLYGIIGCVILLIGIVILPFVPKLINGTTPSGVNIYILYVIYLANSVISYFFSGYRQSILVAYQRSDIINNIATIISVSVQSGQILALFLSRNFYLYAFVSIIGSLITNLCYKIITEKKYPQFRCEGELSYELRSKIRRQMSGLIGTKLNSVVVHSADTVIISAFLGLTATAQYGNYYYIMNSICGILIIIFGSLTAGIGNKLVMDTIEDNFILFKRISFINAWLVGWFTICFLCLYEPFMELWVGKELTLGNGFVILMCIYFFIFEIQRTVLTFKDAAGLWHKDKMRPYVSMVVNLVSNLIMVQFLGIYGVILSTILAFMVSLPWTNYVLFRNLFFESAIGNLIIMVKNFLITALVAVITSTICVQFERTFGGLLFRIVICIVIPNIFFIIIYHKKEEFKYMLEILHGIRKRFLRRVITSEVYTK